MNPPNWERRKLKAGKWPLLTKARSQLSCKKIEADVNDLAEHFDSCFKSGVIKNELLKSNPKLSERLIICSEA